MNAKRILIIFFFLITNTRAGYCQPWYFNQIYNPNETWAGGLNIIGTPNGYFGCTISGDSVSDYFYNTCTFLLDNTGNLVFWKNFGDYGYDYYPGYYGSLVAIQDNSYATFGSRHNFFIGHDEGIFFKFNNLGDTIYTRIFDSDSYNNFIGRTCTKTFDQGFALLGEVQNFSGYSDAVLIKTDSAANEIWRSQLGTDIDDWAVSIFQTADSGYILGTWAYIPVQIVTADPIVIKTDSQGNFEWSLNLGGPYGDDKAMVCNTLDSCIMALTAYADSMYTPEHAYTRINLVKIDLQGNIIWNKKYGASKPVNYISNIISLDNGDFMACGSIRDIDDSDRLGWLFRFNENGDSLWYREYYYYLSANGEAENYLYDVSYTADGGFISTGQAYTLFGPNHIQKMWALKVDSAGCEIPNCWVGIEEEHGSMEAWRHGGMEVWPNPAQGIVDCRWPSFDGRGDCSLVIYDIFGREVEVISIRDRQNKVQINVGRYPNGVYLAVLHEGPTVIANTKFVVSK